MNVIGFCGASGTGKSYRAIEVAKNRGINYVIDDGILILGNRIVVGRSAKREATRVASVKSALFADETKAAQMREAIKKENPDSIMILGTSEKMIEKIAQRLCLPVPCEFVHIEEVATEQEMETAKRMREEEGKHVIPVPTFEIKRDFSGYFIDRVRLLGAKGRVRKKQTGEKSIVRPTFSYMGDFIIADKVITDIIIFTGGCINSISKISLCTLKKRTNGVDIYIEIVVEYGAEINSCAEELIARVREAVESFTGINVLDVQVYVKSLNF